MQACRVDDQIADAALAGDRRALERVTEAWLPTIFQWCARLGGPSIDAEEAALDVLLTFIRRHHTVSDRRAIARWMFSATRRTVANYRRRAWLRRWLPGVSADLPSEDTPQTDLEAAERSRRVFAALDRLSVRDREVLTLCYLEDRPLAEAAEILGVPEGTIKSRLYAARERFRARYEGAS